MHFSAGQELQAETFSRKKSACTTQCLHSACCAPDAHAHSAAPNRVARHDAAGGEGCTSLAARCVTACAVPMTVISCAPVLGHTWRWQCSETGCAEQENVWKQLHRLQAASTAQDASRVLWHALHLPHSRCTVGL
jgi:hypothetical protein